ncbi:MAG: universal stress protein [Gammaproteobacteria bacterium]|nr:universal stress protein [Gammaproteobacteria bacterium]MBI5618240.1 universal stress protein [Gammaproteobacteria bacterium]
MIAAAAWLPWGRGVELPDAAAFAPRRILLASEGRAFTPRALDFAAGLAARGGAGVVVLSIARVWGTAFGLPHPGLMPSVRELAEQREIVAAAVAALERAGVAAHGIVIGARQPAKRIAREARRRDCDTIVMSADAPRHWLIADFMWSQEPYRVRRKSKLPVYLLVDDTAASARDRAGQEA